MLKIFEKAECTVVVHEHFENIFSEKEAIDVCLHLGADLLQRGS